MSIINKSSSEDERYHALDHVSIQIALLVLPPLDSPPIGEAAHDDSVPNHDEHAVSHDACEQEHPKAVRNLHDLAM